VLALDFGRVNTGVAVSDPTGLIARPLPEVIDAASDDGIKRITQIIEEEDVGLVVVGMPISLSGERGKQAEETQDYIDLLKKMLDVDVVAWDERFTSKIAREKGRGAKAQEHSVAASCLLESFLSSDEFKQQGQGPASR
jgi:putative Holliday junction resolvase